MRGSCPPLPVDLGAELVADLSRCLRGGGIPDAEAFRVKPPAECARLLGRWRPGPKRPWWTFPSQKQWAVESAHRNGIAFAASMPLDEATR